MLSDSQRGRKWVTFRAYELLNPASKQLLYRFPKYSWSGFRYISSVLRCLGFSFIGLAAAGVVSETGVRPVLLVSVIVIKYYHVCVRIDNSVVLCYHECMNQIITVKRDNKILIGHLIKQYLVKYFLLFAGRFDELSGARLVHNSQDNEHHP
jgi:hypothetical protein